ncbi:MAG: reprolysin-like metallopeptidase [Saprospiraceae bacterium]
MNISRLFMGISTLVLLSIAQVSAQSKYWQKQPNPATTNFQIKARVFQTYQLDLIQLRKLLSTAPNEMSLSRVSESPVSVFLPNPKGEMVEFQVAATDLMHPDLQRKFPEIKNFIVQSKSSPGLYGRIDVTYQGFHAMIFDKAGNWFVDPAIQHEQEQYIVYYRRDFYSDKTFQCGVDAVEEMQHSVTNDAELRVGDCKQRNYRLAVAATGEYTVFQGGTKALAMSAINTSVNRVVGVMENEFAVRLQLIANNDLIVYTNGATDPYTNGNGGTMLDENQTNVNAVIGTANYDFGHVFSTGGGGVANLNSPCGSSKARGVTGSGAPVNDPFDIDYVAHEMGHQLGGNHTQNNDCNRVNKAAHEPGSASTIMGYAGICSPDVQQHSDVYYHAFSLGEIMTFIQGSGNGCATIGSVQNQKPTVTIVNPNRTIPKQTPFELTAVGADPNGDAITYCWEQMNNQTRPMPPKDTSTAGPNFRSFDPNDNPTRSFPRTADVLGNINPTWEVLPKVTRTMAFRVTVRDNAPGIGCTNEANTNVTTNATSGPFVVTQPNLQNIVWTGGETEEIKWNVAGSNVAPVSATNVDIFLSTDGGFTYDQTLALNVPNDGTQDIVVPNTPSSTVRIKVKGSGNIFYDVSNFDHTIIFAPQSITVLFISPLEYCAGKPIVVPFTSSGNFAANNKFTAQLSNKFGDFGNPTNIGSITGVTQGNINATIPVSANGSNYRIRVVSSNPVIIGTDNQEDIAVSPLLTAAVSVSGPNAGICFGTEVLFQASPQNGGINPTFQWLRNGNVIPGETIDFLLISNLNQGDVIKCRMTSDELCVAVQIVTSVGLTIPVFAPAVPQINITSTDLFFCEGTSVQLAVNSANGGVNPTFVVIKNGQDTIQTIHDSTNLLTINGLTDLESIKVVLISNQPCASPSQASSNVLIFHQKPVVIPSIEIATVNQLNLCADQVVDLIANVGQAGIAPVIEWIINGDKLKIDTSDFFNSDQLQSGVEIYAVVHSNADCSTSLSDTSNLLLVYPNPVLTPGFTGFTFCTGNSVLITEPDQVGNTYEWTMDGNAFDDNMNSFVTVENGGVFVVQATNLYGCTSTASYQILEYPDIQIIELAGPLNPLIGEVSVYTVNAIDSAVYVWTVSGGEIISGQGTSTISVEWPHLGAGFVEVAMSNPSCGDTALLVIDVLSATNQPGDEMLKLYPNPAFSSIYVEWPLNYGIQQIDILDFTGRLVSETEIIQAQNKALIDLQYLPSGPYLIQLKGAEMRVRSFVKLD